MSVNDTVCNWSDIFWIGAFEGKCGIYEGDDRCEYVCIPWLVTVCDHWSCGGCIGAIKFRNYNYCHDSGVGMTDSISKCMCNAYGSLHRVSYNGFCGSIFGHISYKKTGSFKSLTV